MSLLFRASRNILNRVCLTRYDGRFQIAQINVILILAESSGKIEYVLRQKANAENRARMDNLSELEI